MFDFPVGRNLLILVGNSKDGKTGNWSKSLDTRLPRTTRFIQITERPKILSTKSLFDDPKVAGVSNLWTISLMQQNVIHLCPGITGYSQRDATFNVSH